MRQRALYERPRNAGTDAGRALECAVHEVCAGDPRGALGGQATEAMIAAALGQDEAGARRRALARVHADVAQALDAFEAGAPEAGRARWRAEAAREGRAKANARLAGPPAAPAPGATRETVLGGTRAERGWVEDWLALQRQLEHWAEARANGLTTGLEGRAQSEHEMTTVVRARAREEDDQGRADTLGPLERAIVERALWGPCPEEPIGSTTQRMRLKVLSARGETEQAARENALGWLGMALIAKPEGQVPAWQEGITRVYRTACIAPWTIDGNGDTEVERAAREAFETLSRTTRGRRTERARQRLEEVCRLHETLRAGADTG